MLKKNKNPNTGEFKATNCWKWEKPDSNTYFVSW